MSRDSWVLEQFNTVSGDWEEIDSSHRKSTLLGVLTWLRKDNPRVEFRVRPAQENV